MPKILDYDQWRRQQFQDPEFLAELAKQEPGYQIARLRIKLGLTQAQLAERVGTKQPSIARLESGESSPSLKFLGKVARALGADLKVELVPHLSAHIIQEGSGPESYDSGLDMTEQ